MKKSLLVLLLLILPSFALLFKKGYFAIHDDLQTTRQLEMSKCFRDGQIPCRWVLDMGYGYGYPLFNYYPPLPYYLGQVFTYLGFSYIDTAKAIGVVGFIFTALVSFLLAREFWGEKGALLSSVMYTYSPYHSVDFWVRGAVNEFWAMAFYPAILYCSYKLIESHSTGHRVWSKWLPLLSLSIAGLMLSHNPMLMIFVPVALTWSMYWLIRKSDLRSLIPLALSSLWAFGLAAFFTLPVIAEQKYAHVETLIIGYFNYLAHFVPLSRMFFIVKWGYGASGLGQTDFLSFNLGYLQWIIPVIIFISFIFSKKIRSYWSLLLMLLLFTLGSLFMMHSKSTFIWQHFSPLAYLQFPWRFLSIASFTASLLAGAIILVIPSRFRNLSLILIIIGTILLNIGYFHPRVWYPDMTDSSKFSGHSWYLLVTSGIFDYLPIYASAPPADPPGGDLNLTPSGQYITLAKTTNFQEYSLDLASDSVVEIQTYYFPGWHVWLDGLEQTIDPARDPLLGRMKINVPSGRHVLTARFTNTPIRTLGNDLSLVAWILILGWIIWPYLGKTNLLAFLPKFQD